MVHPFSVQLVVEVVGDFCGIPRDNSQSVKEARHSSVAERPLMVRWVVGSILHGGLIDLFLFPVGAPRLV